LALLLAQFVPTVAQQPTQAQRDAIRKACPSDYRAHCADVPTGGKAALACLQQHAASLSPACQRAVKAASGGSAPSRPAPSSGAAAAATAPAVAAQPMPAMTLREQIMVLRQSCAGDYRALCGGVPLGGGRAIACLRANAASLSPQCGEALSGARQGL
jgi:Cysteine rich repeat